MSGALPITIDHAVRIYGLLIARATGIGNDHALACMIASAWTGRGSLPAWLGLSPAAFHCLVGHHFPGATLPAPAFPGLAAPEPRPDELADLVRLMLIDKAGVSPSEVWMAHIVAAGCMASDHLWSDLGLWSRTDLTALMRRNFPALAARNVRDMRWKRFLYKQLCETEGVYTCRAPSCEVCVDYQGCFGPEA
ncbi:nitrogen fixation protein NifQ [Candidatus Thiosymbion oneisti]|uniref:nitrogen fixation protein NifQ n=1 Tax=Candidatus Thiosymbion oneisti TaxID=589554 RepID=UPI000B128327|nr:nitrogen fixation protein NifQ [Candidatus Thiosymbion oneisti]